MFHNELVAALFSTGSDHEHDFEESDGEAYFTIIEELRRGDLEGVKRRVTEDCRIANEMDLRMGMSVLHWATAMTDEDGLREARAKRHGRKLSSRRAIVQLLLDHGAEAWRIWWQESFFGDHYGKRPWDMTKDDQTQRVLMNKCIDQFRSIKAAETKVHREILNSTLCAAAFLDDEEVIREAIESGAEVNNDTCDCTALSIAAEKGNLSTVKYLVERCGARVDYDIDQNGTTALSEAIFSGKAETVQYLIDAGANIFHYKFQMGASIFFCESLEVVRVVLDAMMQQVPTLTNGYKMKLAFEIFTGHGCLQGLQLLVEKEAKIPSNILQQAVVRGQKDALEYLIAEGALSTYDANASKVCAYGSGHARVARRLVDECQSILDQMVEARSEWTAMTSSERH